MKTPSPTFVLPLGKRLILFLCITVLCFVITGALNTFIMHFKGLTPATLRISAVLQDVLAFVLPAVGAAVLVTRYPATLLCIDRRIPSKPLVLAIGALITSIPAMNAIVEWNESITLPESMAGIEQWMRQSEMSARQSVDILLGGHDAGSLVMGLLIAAVLAGFSEELFFRGAFQRLLSTGGMNHHVAIWVVAFVFSAGHLQFYGFFGRLLLGAYFGYLLWWTRVLWVPVLIHILNNGIYIVGNYMYPDADTAGAVQQQGSTSAIGIILSVFFTVFLLCVLYRSTRSCKK